MKTVLISLLGVVLSISSAQAKIMGTTQDKVQADALMALVAAADQTLPRLPNVHFKTSLMGQCGADRGSNPYVLYCPSHRKIYMRTGVVDELGAGAAGYLLGHVYGHAAQVRYGVADIALATIRANRGQETQLRGHVTRQVECVSGVLNKRAGMPSGSLTNWFNAEPLADSHWGASPIARGPVVSIGLSARASWFRKGWASGDFADCGSGVFPADLLVDAAR